MKTAFLWTFQAGLLTGLTIMLIARGELVAYMTGVAAVIQSALAYHQAKTKSVKDLW